MPEVMLFINHGLDKDYNAGNSSFS